MSGLTNFTLLHYTLAYTIVAWIIRASMVPVVLRRQFAPGAAWAWLGIVFLHPYIGVALYLLVGESRLKPQRKEIHRQIVAQFRSLAEPAASRQHLGPGADVHPVYEPMVLQAEKISEMPIRSGGPVELLTECPQFVNRLVNDIDAAKSQVNLLYYMFVADQTGEQVADAMIRAASRGVKCRILADAVASRPFWSHSGLAVRLAAGKVEVAAAMPVASSRRGIARLDLRNHRKLAIIDERIAYAGSHNLINADYGGRRGAPWVDVTGRFVGPVVAEFAGVFCEDWAFETAEFLTPGGTAATDNVEPATPMQVVPTGPDSSGGLYRSLLLAAIQSARSRLIITTPYFVPDEPTLVSLTMAADQGVDVKLILPLRPDHFFTAAAGRAHFAKLMEAGVEIYLYRPGLLHSKTTTVDDAFALFGSANLDVRSFHLNFELSVLMYGRQTTEQLRNVQNQYLRDSRRLDAKEWSARSPLKSYADGAISLLSPLL